MTNISVNIGSVKGLLPDGTTLPPETKKFSSPHLGGILNEVVTNEFEYYTLWVITPFKGLVN